MQQPYVLGIDIGTGSTKGVAVTSNGAAIAVAQAYYPMLQTDSFFSEQDPEVIWDAFVTTIRKIIGKVGPPRAVSFFDVQQLQWFAPSLDFCGIRTTQLSTPVPTHFVRTNLPTTVSSLLGLSSGTLFCIGASDGCLANVGSNALHPGTAALTIG